MAKDGTLRGGARLGAGAKRKPLADKIAEGNPGKRALKVIELPEPEDMEGVTMPRPSDYLKEQQRDGTKLDAEDIYKETWEWLDKYGCTELVSKSIIERYAMAVARYIQCEHAMSSFGLLSKHPTTGKPTQSPYVAMSQSFSTQADRLWLQISQVVRDNCATDYGGKTPQDDMMERLLKAREG